jgi:ribosomal protein L30/L7E
MSFVPADIATLSLHRTHADTRSLTDTQHQDSTHVDRTSSPYVQQRLIATVRIKRMGSRMLPKLTPMIRNMIAMVDPIITGYSLYMITCDMVKSEIMRHNSRIESESNISQSGWFDKAKPSQGKQS